MITTIVSPLLALDDDAWFDRRRRRAAPGDGKGADVTDVPGVVFIQLDGVAQPCSSGRMRSGDVPTLHRWLRRRRATLTSAGRPAGRRRPGSASAASSTARRVDMPAFRWVDKATGEVVVSNHPKSAAAIERAHSDGNGLLAHHGSSYGNLFSGDAERAVLTMSGVGQAQGGRTGAGYFGYFARPRRRRGR